MASPDLITVKGFVGQNSVWHSLMPTLEQFTRYANRQPDRFAWPVHAINEDRRAAFVAEVAFEIAASGGSAPDRLEMSARAAAALARMPGSEKAVEPLVPQEWQEAIRLAANLDKYLEDRANGEPHFRPEIPGCGTVLGAVADVIAGSSELIEVKMVRRGFRSADFRQVVTYAAMLNAVGRQVTHISIVNPRTGFFFYSSAADFALDCGAASWTELLQDLASAMEGLRLSI